MADLVVEDRPDAAMDLNNETRHDAGGANLNAAAERYKAANPNQQRAAFRALVEAFKGAAEAKRFEELATALRSTLTPVLDYTSVHTLQRFYRLLPAEVKGPPKLKLAILGGFTTHQLKDFIELYLFAAGIPSELYEADYGVFRQEILDPSSELYRFAPNRIFLATHWRNLGHLPALSDNPQHVSDPV